MVPGHRSWPILAAVTSIGLLVPVAFPTGGRTAEGDKPVIGAVEEVLLLPWEIRLRARVDTGAAISSIDARGIQIRRTRGGRSVRFSLVSDTGGRITLQLPLAGYEVLKSPDAPRERRPLVEMDVCVAGSRVPLRFTLNDRSGMQYRVLLGRNMLADRFLVDAGRTFTSRATCPPDR